ncbi:MAG: hypothetical protein QXI16_05970 [Sulfolobaceae archaeon]
MKKLRVDKSVLIRDWLTVDFAIFNRKVTTENFDERFVQEWNNYKHDLLVRYYTIHEDELPKFSLDPVSEAIYLADKLKYLLIARAKREGDRLRTTAWKLQEAIYAHKPARQKRDLAVRLVLAKEALCELVGEENSHIFEMVKLLARSTK